ncbi:MAG: radical SAM protein [Candidatus Aenigmatarchaeota archaeon]
MIEIKETKCKNALSRSGIYGIDYSINPYIGCEHNCCYCFARYMKKFSHSEKEWGEFVVVKKNIFDVFREEIKKVKSGSILISSVTDAYQPIEEKYEITRKILEEFTKHDNFQINILTKSKLVMRDLDIIKKIKNIEIGFSFSVLSEDIKKIIEPHSSEIKERLKALKILKENEIKTYAMLAPILPILTEKDLEKLLECLKDVEVDYILVDRLNIKAGNWQTIKESIAKIDERLIKQYEDIIFSQRNEYFIKIKEKIKEICNNLLLSCYFCY